MRYQYTAPMRCEVGGDVEITVLVTAENAGGCQIDASEEPVDCSRKDTCPGGSQCLLNGMSRDKYFNIFD